MDSNTSKPERRNKMRVIKTQIVPIEKLKVDFYVRKKLNEDHVIFLAELIEGGVQLPPIQITKDWVVIDGRHRIEAHQLVSKNEIMAEIVELESEVEIISQAYRSNMGGSLPPTPEDTEHTIVLLLEHGESSKKIAELLGLPVAMTRKYVNNVKSKLARQKLMKAVDAVTEGGLTIAEAALKYDVSEDSIKNVLSGNKRRKEQFGISELHSQLTSTYQSVSIKNARIIEKLIENFKEGDVSESQVREIFAHIKNLQKKSSRRISDWEKRFDALAKSLKKL
jgi:ParB-like chromosome segregation protein Spo0J